MWCGVFLFETVSSIFDRNIFLIERLFPLAQKGAEGL